MKRRSLGITLFGALAAAILLGLVGPASAAQFVFLVDDAKISAPGVARSDGEVMVPAAAAARIFGGAISADATLRQTVLQANNTEIGFFSGKNRVLINGEELRIPHTPAGGGGAMMIPLGFTAETVGAKLVREGATRIRVENGAFPPRASAAEVQLRITSSGVFHSPAVWRAFPTFDRLDVSAQDLANMLGAELKWDPELGAAIVSVDTHTLLFFCGKRHAIADGQPVSLSRVPVMSRSQLLIPLGDACRMLGRSLTQKTMWTFAIGIPE